MTARQMGDGPVCCRHRGALWNRSEGRWTDGLARTSC
jgi:hypothetical protein